MDVKTFRTEIATSRGILQLKPQDTVVFMGSCFADNISKKLTDGLMDCWANPYGTAYNPLSVGEQIERIIEKKACSDQEIIKSGETYFSWLSHSKLQASSEAKIKDLIDQETNKMHKILQKASLLAITFGTSWTYRLKETGVAVANCHKQPQELFIRERLTVDEITDLWTRVIAKLRELNPKVHIMMTISPIRHVKDTMHGNQLSKAILLEATEKLIETTTNASYFEAYEIMLDELRDYRFYAEDMVHPNQTAIDFIYEKFAEAYMSNETKQMIKDGQKLTMASTHRQMGSNCEFEKFINSTLVKVEEFKTKYKMSNDIHSIAQLVKLLNNIKSQCICAK